MIATRLLLILLVATLVGYVSAQRKVVLKSSTDVCYDTVAIGATVYNSTLITSGCRAFEANLVMSSSYTFYYILQGSHDSIVASISTSSSSWSASAVLVNFKMKRTVCSSVPIGSYCTYATITCQWDGHSTSLGLTVS